MGVTVRTARPDEVEAVLLVWLAAGSVPSVSDDADALLHLLDRDAEALLVADADGSVVGTLVVGWDGWRGSLYRLAVVPECRRRGIARLLVAAAERRLAARGGPRMSAIVEDDNESAVEFWAAAGYTCLPGHSRFVKNLSG